MNDKSTKSPWWWVPSLYYAQGIPYVVVMTVSVIMFKRLGISNADIAFYTGWLYLPWVIKPLWSPFVDVFKTKRWWIITMQLLVGAGLSGVALSLPLPHFFQYSLAFLWLLAFSSATHDIAADGFYMLSLKEDQQSYFVGIRSTFYRLAMISGQGLLVIMAGFFEVYTQNIPLAWSITFVALAVLFICFFVYHKKNLPHTEADIPRGRMNMKTIFDEFMLRFISFFGKRNIFWALSFILLFRLGEAQLVKMATPFMLDSTQKGGLGLMTSEVGLIYGTIGILALTIGGIIGGIVASKYGLKFWILPMTVAINIPNLVYVYLSYAQPQSIWFISGLVALEQFGYGFGFTAFMLYLIYFSEGNHKTAHFAFCTGFMALGMMLPGMVSGWIQEAIGYQSFFIWVMVCSIPGFIILRFLKIERNFGKRGD